MGLGDKIQNAAEKAGGKAKATAGAATGDDSLKAEAKRTRPKATCRPAKSQRRLQKRLSQNSAWGRTPSRACAPTR